MTTGAPKVMLGTKWPSMISICSHEAPWPMVSEQAAPKAAKSADKMEGAMMACGAIMRHDRVRDRWLVILQLWLGYRKLVSPTRRLFTLSSEFSSVNGLIVEMVDAVIIRCHPCLYNH